MEYNKAYCLARSEYHDRESENAKRDAETVASDPAHTLQSHHYDMFIKLHEEHSKYAKAWRESAAGMHKEQVDRWNALAAGEME